MMIKKIVITSLFLCCTIVLSAQLTYGTTGLLHVPSAEMQRDKTVRSEERRVGKECL